MWKKGKEKKTMEEDNFNYGHTLKVRFVKHILRVIDDSDDE